MNSNQIRQISEEEIKSQLTPEELQKTQVLNLQELQATVKFEKRTSKKPAIIIAVIGIICLTFGSSIQIMSALRANNNIQKRDTNVNNIEVETTKLDCTKTTLNTPDGTNNTYNLTYTFENDKLVGLTKIYNISASSNNEEGKKQIEKYITEYDQLLNNTDGYKITLSHTENIALVIKVEIDYKLLDLTKLKNINQTKTFTKVDYNKNTPYSEIRKAMLEEGYTVK